MSKIPKKSDEEVTASSGSFEVVSTNKRKYRLPSEEYRDSVLKLPQKFDIKQELHPPTAGPPITRKMVLAYVQVYGLWRMTEPELRAHLFLRADDELKEISTQAFGAMHDPPIYPKTEDEAKLKKREKIYENFRAHAGLIHSIIRAVEEWRKIEDPNKKRNACPWAYPDMLTLTWTPTFYLQQLFETEPLNSAQRQMVLEAIRQFRGYRRDLKVAKLDADTRQVLRASLKARIDKLKLLRELSLSCRIQAFDAAGLTVTKSKETIKRTL